MKKTGYAYFVESPRTIDDLMEPYPIEQETAYEIVKTVKLSGIDYENFITDMIADRQFIEDHAALRVLFDDQIDQRGVSTKI